MRREIKFRVWDAIKKKMYFPTMLAIGVYIVFDNPQDFLMEYTGLKDTNNKDIYEGDIIGSATVTYCGDQEEGLGMNAGWYLQWRDFESWEELESRHNDNGDNYKIIGNIYENPELIN